MKAFDQGYGNCTNIHSKLFQFQRKTGAKDCVKAEHLSPGSYHVIKFNFDCLKKSFFSLGSDSIQRLLTI